MDWSYRLSTAAHLAIDNVLAGIHAAKTLALGPFAEPSRGEMRRMARLIKPKPPIASVSASYFVEDVPIVLKEVDAETVSVTFLELSVLAAAAQKYKPKTILEFGTFDGRTTLNLAANAPQAKLYTIDLPPSETDVRNGRPIRGKCFLGKPESAQIRQLTGDTFTFDFSPYRADFVFIDAGHTYECIINDTRKALALGPKIIFWHDYTSHWTGVAKAINELAGEYPIKYIRDTTLAFLEL